MLSKERIAEMKRYLYDGHSLMRDENIDLIDAVETLTDGLRSVLSLVEDGWLVRNIDDDDKPDFVFRQIEPVRKLKAATEALTKVYGEEISDGKMVDMAAKQARVKK